jgi:N-acetylmuramoyl-L-alanine amidase
MKTTPKNYALSRYFLLSSLLLLAGTVLAGCARGPRLTPEASLDYGRFALRELPPEINLDALKGRRIVIDPGHGGSFAGAVGPNNLREADVNLGVSLYLWGMLKQAGADVVLTRAGDSNVYEGDDLDLKKDLHARAEFAGEQEADLFVSLHHNADVLPGKKKNSLETYFKMTDPGPSFDVARSIHRHLAISLGQEDNVILPGNFHVLRENTVTAILGEPSYITHAGNAFRLGLAPMQRIEAQAYFLGIAEYFANGVPTIEEVSPSGIVADNPLPQIVARIHADEGVPIDPASVTMLIDDVPVSSTFNRETSEIRHLPTRRFANGRHEITISMRNINGNAARPWTSEFHVTMPPAYVLLDSNFDALRAGSRAPARLSARVFDADLMPVADGTPVKFGASTGGLAPNPSPTRNGQAICYLLLDAGEQPREVEVTASAASLSHGLKIEVAADGPRFHVMKVVGAATDRSIEGVLASAGGSLVAYSDRFGYLAFSPDQLEGAPIELSRNGFEPTALTDADAKDLRVIKMKRIAAGMLAEKRFVLDPQLGGEERGVTGPTGMRASDLNLQVAGHLASLLEASGAEVALTRESDETINELRRVETEERFDAEWFISIGHTVGENGFGLIHYPTSEDGAKLARSIAQYLMTLEPHEDATVESYSHFVLTHTGSPAVMVQGPAPSTAEIEQEMTHPAAARIEAYAIYCGILANLGLREEDTGRIFVKVLGSDGKAISNATAVLDGAFHMQTNARGEFAFHLVTPGDHRLEIHDGEAILWEGSIPVGSGDELTVEVSRSGPTAIWKPGLK